MCFIIDPDGKCASGRVEKFQQDCSARGYTQTCTGNGQVHVGDPCDGKYYKKCECESGYDYVKPDNNDGYNYSDACTIGGVTKYKYKTCQSQYKYALSAISADASKHILGASTCTNNSTAGGNECVEVMLNNTKRYDACVCDTGTYKYTSAGTGFVVGGQSCKGTDGILRYEKLSCASDYQDTCGSNDPGYNVDEKKDTTVTPNLVCKKCTPKACNISKFQPTGKDAYLSKETWETCPTGFKSETYTVTNSTLTCRKCTPYTSCEDYNGNYHSSCGGGYTSTSVGYKDLVVGYNVGADGKMTGSTDSVRRECFSCWEKTCTDYNYWTSYPSTVPGYKVDTLEVELGETMGTCYLLVPKTCADYKTDDDVYQLQDTDTCSGSGYEPMSGGSKQTGDTDSPCFYCRPKTCEDYIENGVRLQSSTCSSGYTQTSYTKALGSNSNGTCYRCVRRTSSEFTLTITPCHVICSSGRVLTLTPVVSTNGSAVSAGQHSGGNYDMSIPYSGNAKDQFRLVMKETTAGTTSTRTQRDAVNGRVDAVSYNFKAGSYYTVTCEIGSCGSSS